MANMLIKKEVLEYMREHKIHPRESDSDCVKRIFGLYEELSLGVKHVPGKIDVVRSPQLNPTPSIIGK